MPQLKEDQASSFMHRVGDEPPALYLIKGVNPGSPCISLALE